MTKQSATKQQETPKSEQPKVVVEKPKVFCKDTNNQLTEETASRRLLCD